MGPLYFQRILGIAVVCALGGCVGTMKEKFPNSQASDASPVLGTDPFAPGADIPVCLPSKTPRGDGNHRAGEDCLLCHSQGGQATPFAIAGTLYSNAQGGAPVSGKTIIIDDSSGQRYSLISESNGNFYSTDPITFPVKTTLAVCPDVAAMITQVPLASASCNSASCHSSGFRIHLP